MHAVVAHMRMPVVQQLHGGPWTRLLPRRCPRTLAAVLRTDWLCVGSGRSSKLCFSTHPRRRCEATVGSIGVDTNKPPPSSSSWPQHDGQCDYGRGGSRPLPGSTSAWPTVPDCPRTPPLGVSARLSLSSPRSAASSALFPPSPAVGSSTPLRGSDGATHTRRGGGGERGSHTPSSPCTGHALLTPSRSLSTLHSAILRIILTPPLPFTPADL